MVIGIAAGAGKRGVRGIANASTVDDRRCSGKGLPQTRFPPPGKGRIGELPAEAGSFFLAPTELRYAVRSDASKQHKDDHDDQYGAEHTDASVTEAVTVAAEATTEATKKKDDEDDNENGSERHALLPLCTSSVAVTDQPSLCSSS